MKIENFETNIEIPKDVEVKVDNGNISVSNSGKTVSRSLKHKKGLGLGDAPQAVMIVGFIFLLMATVAFVSSEYGDSLTTSSIAANVTDALEMELSGNTDIAGIVLTIVLVGIILTVLVGVFAASRRGGL